MIRRSFSFCALVVGFVVLASGCGPGEPAPGAAESVSITIDNGTPDNNTTGTAVAGAYYTTQNGSIPAASTAITVSGGSGPSTLIRFNGKTTGTFKCSEGTASVSYTNSSGQLHIAAQNVTGTSCEVTVSEVGAVGSVIKGALTATANKFSGGAPSSATATVTGSFSVVRDADK